MSHHARFVVAYGSCVAWQTYTGAPPFGSGIRARAQTSDSFAPTDWAAESLDSVSTRKRALSGELLLGFSHSSFQKIKQPAWHPPCACPSQRVSRWTARSTRRPRVGKTVSHVLCARL